MTEKTKDPYRRTRMWVRVVWPIFLITRFMTYAFLDSPTHFIFWHSSREVHASFYVVGALLVAATVNTTPRRILEMKALLIWVIGFTSAMGDIIVHHESSSQRWNSSVSWIGIIIANQIVIKLRISTDEKEEKA